MLKRLTLKNFRQHEDLDLSFVEGLNVLRGANESGKSTIFEAVIYALYGARGLIEPIDLTVTWGKDVKTLAVSLELDFAGQTYSIRRSKTGASLTCGTVLVSGQSEVTGFIENLFGVPLSIATQIQFASQSQLRNIVDAGAATIGLIESLSGLNEIDAIIDKIQTQLPCGTPVTLEAQVAKLSDLREPVEDHFALEHVINTIQAELEQSDSTLEFLAASQAAINKAEHEKTVLAYELEEREITRLRKRVADTAAKTTPVKPPGPTLAEIAQAEAVHITMQGLSTAHMLYERLPRRSINSTKTLVQAHIAKAQELILASEKDIRELEIANAALDAYLIKDKECTLCGKDLTDVPEVMARNSRTAEHITANEKDLNSKKLWLASQQAVLKGLLQDQADLTAAYKLAEECQYLSITEAEEHTLVSFTGDVEALKSYNFGDPNFFGGFDRLRKLWQQYALDSAAYEAVVSTIAKDLEELRRLEANRTDKSAATQALSNWQHIASDLEMVKNRRAEIADRLNTATTNLAVARALHAAAVQTYTDNCKALEEAKEALALLHYHNALIKKLREARPVVAAQLWALVLTTVSTMFSTIRGEPSTVSRNSEGFLVNGRAVKALSGSTKDSLGLALRYGLQRTFLPLVDFAMVDEPASGCDDIREEAMIGQLSSCGYRQVIMVTHSDLADAFATNLIRI